MKFKLILTTLLAASLAGCAANDPNQRAKTGAAVGAVVGAVLGHQLDDNAGRYVGAAVGAAAGGAVGHKMDSQQQDFERTMQQERANNAVQIERLQDNTLKLSLNSEVSFDFNSADINIAFMPTLDKVAEMLNKYANSSVQVVGHTDGKGSDTYNLGLSQRRAGSVVNYLAGKGVMGGRLTAEGRGESAPRATNDTEAGRQLNRRVEIFIKSTEEGNNNGSYQQQPAPAPTY